MEGDRQKDAKGMQEEKNHYDWSSSSDTSQEDNVEAEKRRSFRCGSCSRSFIRFFELTKHKKKHHGVEISGSPEKTTSGLNHQDEGSPELRTQSEDFQCSICSKTFKKKNYLRMHGMLHGKKIFICTICEKTFSVYYLIRHLKSHSKRREKPHMHKKKQFFELTKQKKKHHEVKIISSESSEKITSKTFGLDHQNDVSLLQKPHSKDFQCSHCSKTFKKKQSLRLHERLHGEKIFKLTSSAKTMRSTQKENNSAQRLNEDAQKDVKVQGETDDDGSDFSDSSQEDNTDAEKRRSFRCGSCSKTFIRFFELTKHKTKHHGVEISGTPEKITSKTSGDVHQGEEPLNLHLKKDPPDFQCSHCSKTFKTKRGLRKHEKLHGEKIFKCTICEKAFSTKNYLAIHLKSHSERRDHECQECGKTFKTKNTLRQHHMIHSSEKPHVCKICGEGFKMKGSLLRHSKLHTKNPKNFKCAHCGEIFLGKKSLNHHLTSHRKEKYSFDGKFFKSQTELERYLRANSIMWNFQCDQCPKAYKHRGSLQKHQLNAHEKILSDVAFLP
ncbi:zinc finger protein 585A-like [Lutzomyia longipalpis]|uniref:zinc finger protein 585A-like n=1 Tax=Lutzomyia longipalpis TaxID=7200 RepID=UPI002483B686|nr:zinc finger protein 585A-like [Lutzomyia longipalpis]